MFEFPKWMLHVGRFLQSDLEKTWFVIAAIAVTVGTFTVAKRNPELFKLRTDGYHSVSRTRGHMWINGQKIKLDPRDPGGEHE